MSINPPISDPPGKSYEEYCKRFPVSRAVGGITFGWTLGTTCLMIVLPWFFLRRNQVGLGFGSMFGTLALQRALEPTMKKIQHRLEFDRGGWVISWTDSDEGDICMGLVRGDGKILSSDIIKRRPASNEDLQGYTARMVRNSKGELYLRGVSKDGYRYADD